MKTNHKHSINLNMKKLLSLLSATCVIMAANAQTESAFIDPVALLGEEAATTPVSVAGGTVFCQSANVKMKAAWDDTYKIAYLVSERTVVHSITIDNEIYSLDGDAVQGQTNPKENSLLTGGQTSGAVYKFEVTADGNLYIFGNFNYSKNYYVWEGDVANGAGKAIAYTLRAYTAYEGTEVGYTLPADKLGYYAAMGYDAEGVANFTSNPTYDDGTKYNAAGTIAGNWSEGYSVGVISFPVRKAAGQYYVNACVSKLASNGFVFIPTPKEITGISTLRAEETANCYFDLAGRRSNAKGLVITNGKVVLVK